MKRFKTLALALLVAGCASTGTRSNETTRSWEGTTFDYIVSVRERSVDSFCKSREITLRAQNKTMPYDAVTYVRATDKECNNSIDEWYFRNPLDRRKMSTRLEQDVLNAYYTTMPLR